MGARSRLIVAAVATAALGGGGGGGGVHGFVAAPSARGSDRGHGTFGDSHSHSHGHGHLIRTEATSTETDVKPERCASRACASCAS